MRSLAEMKVAIATFAADYKEIVSISTSTALVSFTFSIIDLSILSLIPSILLASANHSPVSSWNSTSTVMVTGSNMAVLAALRWSISKPSIIERISLSLNHFTVANNLQAIPLETS